MGKFIFVMMVCCMLLVPCFAQDKTKKKSEAEGPVVAATEKAEDNFGKVFEGYVQVDASFFDVCIVRTRTKESAVSDVGLKFTGTTLNSVVERVEPAVIEWVRDDEEMYIFMPTVPVDWFDTIVVYPKEKTLHAEKIVDGRRLTYDATAVKDATRCLNYRCGILYRFDPKPDGCDWLGKPPPEGDCMPR